MRNNSFVPLLTAMLTVCVLVSCKKEDSTPPELSSISVKISPTKIEYYEDERLDLSGLVIAMSYDNGTSVDLEFSDLADQGITCTPAHGVSLKQISNSITITHTSTGKNTSQPITFITLSDTDGNSYPHVKIGEQIWMGENLKTTKYNDGTAIALVSDMVIWDNLITAGYCWYDNNKDTYANTYGALYNWYTVETGKLCPDGWHVPSDTEWTELTNYLASNGHPDTEGLALSATSGWDSKTNGTDVYGFTALPAGIHGFGKFERIGIYAYWWSATEHSSTQGKLRIIMDFNDLVFEDHNNKQLGFSVRCLKD